MDTGNQVRILDDVVCIVHYTNTFGIGINTTGLPPTMSK